MSKEELLLELVLDKFSNIKGVLNATKDIEHYLMKLKQNEKTTINVVQSDEILNKTKKLIDTLYDHSMKVKDEFYEHYNKLENTSIEKSKRPEGKGNLAQSEDGSNILKDSEDKAENEEDNVECNSVENNNSDDKLEDSWSASVDAEKVILENDRDNIVECNNLEVENDSDETTLDENNPELVQEDPLAQLSGSEIEDNTLDDTSANASKDDTILENSNLGSNTSKEIAEGTVSSDVIESSIMESNSKSGDNEKDLADKEDKNCEDAVDIKLEPKALIRLVDLSKLIDPKPKKSVKFDSSVIILTSSDEDSNTPKKKSDVKGSNCKLKSALKNSPINKDGDGGRQIKNKEQSITSLNENKNGSSSDSDDLELHDGKNKTKLNKCKRSSVRDTANLGLKENSSGSHSDSDESNTDCKKSSESLSSKSRRSSRIDNKLNETKKRKDNLKKIFKRKSTKSGRSDFEIVSDKLNDDSGGDLDSSNIRKRKSAHRKRDLQKEHLSDTSSLSDGFEDDVRVKSKNSKKIKHKIDVCTDGRQDEKFSYKVYIPLPRIECSQMKEIYLRNREILEIKRLTNVNLPKSHKRSRATKNDSKSSSDTEKPKSKKSKNVPKDTPEDSQICDNESAVTNVIDDELDKSTAGDNVENKDDKMVAIALENLENAEKRENKSGSEDSGSDEGKKKKSVNDKERKNSDKENESKDLSDSTEAKKSHDEAKSKKNLGDPNEENDDGDKDKNSHSEGSDDQKKKADKEWRKDKLLTSKIDSSDSELEFSKYCKKKDKSREEIMRKAKKRGHKSIFISDSENSGEDKKESDERSNKSESSDEKSDSDDEEKRKKDEKKKVKKKVKKAILISDSESSGEDKKKSGEKSSDKSESSDGKSDADDEEARKEEETKKRRRIKRTKDSSSSSDDEKATRKQIRRLIGKDSLSETTKQAEAEEKERKARIAEKQKKYNKFFEAQSDSKVEKLVLDYDERNKKELLAVQKSLVKKLKPHQASGVQFMWDACFESLERVKSTKGSGCILAHCMGLGKTLQVITLVHALLTNSEKTGISKVMVVCPLNTVLNWKAEFKKWLPKEELEVYELVSCKQNYERQYVVQEWHTDGGILILGYHMFRNLSNPDNKRISKKLRTVFQEGLLDPGPDLVICDEGHLLKNEKTHLSIAMNRIKTARRIVLTGTPLQNNLKEYWCMVQFIKPNLLGTYKEYLNRFVNPIINGQYTDSTQHDILLMRKRSHVLHKLLDGVVQRRDYAVLEPYLPPKHEYVLFVSLTETQVKLYSYYMEKFARQNDGSSRTSFLFTDFQNLQRICTHPRVLLDKSNERKEKFDDEEESEGSLKDFIDDDEGSASDSSSSSSLSGSGSDRSDDKKKKKKSKPQQKVRVTRALAAQRKENNEDDSDLEIVARKEWWQEFCDDEELDNINNSGKLFLLFQILKECEEIGDKILVFSQSLYTLNCIEYFLERIDEATQKGETEKVGGHSGSWAIGLDYFRLDGSSSCDNRATWCDMFNNPSNIRARLFLISTKAGGLGINLVAANRVIIFDVSWNPSHDIQSIYRVYRFGQTKPCYIYRFVAYGTMEMKVYERQVTKQAISKRVIDEQQIDRHYNQNDLQELYRCDLTPTDRPIPLVPKDVLLGELLQKYEKTIFKYHLHQSLLENKEAEGLNEEERKAAWDEFENEKVLRKTTSNVIGNPNANFMNAHAIEAALASIVRKDNPTWSEVQIKGILPALVQQLQVQLSEGDMTMYARVQQELQIMQAMHTQKLKEAYYQQQVMRLIQQQEQQAKLLGNMNVNPAQVSKTQSSMLKLNNLLGHLQGGPSSTSSRPIRPASNDVIELND